MRSAGQPVSHAPATAITIILTVAGMTLGAVVAVVALLGMVLATVAAKAEALRAQSGL